MGLVVPPPPRVAQRNTVVLLGDSITANCLQLSGTQNAYGSFYWYAARGYWAWLAAFLRQRLRLLKVAGVSGETSTQILARFQADVVAYRPGWCILLCGTNDVSGVNSLSLLQSNVTSMLDQGRAAGIQMVVLTIPPLTGGTTAQLNTIHSYNYWLKQQALTRDQPPIIVDIHAALADATTTDEWINKATPQYTADGIHPAAWGAARMGRLIADALIPLVPRIDTLGFSTADGTTVTPANLHPNSGNIGTSGTTANGATGTVPNAVQVKSFDNASLAGTVTSSIVAATWDATSADGDRSSCPWHQVAITGTASKLAIYAQSTTGWSVGDRISAACEFDMDTDWSSVTLFRFKVGAFNGSYQNVIAYGIDGVDTGFPTAENPLRRVVLRTPEIVIPSGATTVYWQIDMQGLGTLRYRRAEIRKNPQF